MIAAIERTHNVVWGIGETKADAIADANNEMKTKTFNPGINANELECVPLQPDSKLTGCGIELYQYCDIGQQTTEDQPAQIGLF